MFKSEVMYKVRVISLETGLRTVVQTFHKLGVIELRRTKLGLNEVQTQEYINAINELLVRVDGALTILEKPQKSLNAEPKNKIKHMPFEELSKKINGDKTLVEIYSLNDKKKELEDELKLATSALSVGKKLNTINMNFSKLSSDAIIVKAFEISHKALRHFKSDLLSNVKNIEITSNRTGSIEAVVVAYDKKANIENIIKKYEIMELDLSSKELVGTPAQVISSTTKKINALNIELDQISKRIKELSLLSYSRIAAYSELLNIELSRSNATALFKKTDNTVVIEGWIARKKEQILKKELEEKLSGTVYIERINTDDELAPTLINHPKFLRSFDYMIEFFSLPRSDEIDPSWIFIISFPIFYGFMISDVGYGIMSLILSTFIKRKTDPNGLMYNTATLWQINSISAMFFGFISNQYLGMPFNQYFTGFTGINWFADISYIAVISILFGLTQILLGLIFGFINEYRHHKKKLAISKLTSFTLVLFSSLAIAGALFGSINYTLTLISTVLGLASLVLTILLSGEKALEIIDLISHSLSYMRIMGFGLASVIIAFLIDFAFTPKLSDGILVFILYLVIFLILHVLNMIVSIFEGLVQGLRLNFVEFFTKFYEGGGQKFKPFSYKRVYTKE